MVKGGGGSGAWPVAVVVDVAAAVKVALVAAALALAAGGRPARAADTNPDAKEAREHAQKGDGLFFEHDFQGALTEYEKGFLARTDPSFLYNMAQCYRLMGDREAAVRFYRRYLATKPREPTKTIAENHFHELEKAIASGEPPRIPAPPPAARVPPSSRTGMGGTPAPAPPPPKRTNVADEPWHDPFEEYEEPWHDPFVEYDGPRRAPAAAHSDKRAPWRPTAPPDLKSATALGQSVEARSASDKRMAVRDDPQGAEPASWQRGDRESERAGPVERRRVRAVECAFRICQG